MDVCDGLQDLHIVVVQVGPALRAGGVLLLQYCLVRARQDRDAFAAVDVASALQDECQTIRFQGLRVLLRLQQCEELVAFVLFVQTISTWHECYRRATLACV